MSENANDHEDSNGYTWDSTNMSSIFLNGDVVTTSGSGIIVDGNIATINSSGNYFISGTLNDGQINFPVTF
jgi:hypothetical protein